MRLEAKSLGINTSTQLPEWLTPDVIEEYKISLKKAVPYTYEEYVNIPLDSDELDYDRLEAFEALELLTKYNLI